MSTKELIKDLIDKFSIVNGAKYFSLGIFQKKGGITINVDVSVKNIIYVKTKTVALLV